MSEQNVRRFGHSEFYRGDGLDMREDGPYVAYEDYRKLEDEIASELTFPNLSGTPTTISLIRELKITRRALDIAVTNDTDEFNKIGYIAEVLEQATLELYPDTGRER